MEQSVITPRYHSKMVTANSGSTISCRNPGFFFCFHFLKFTYHEFHLPFPYQNSSLERSSTCYLPLWYLKQNFLSSIKHFISLYFPFFMNLAAFSPISPSSPQTKKRTATNPNMSNRK